MGAIWVKNSKIKLNKCSFGDLKVIYFASCLFYESCLQEIHLKEEIQGCVQNKNQAKDVHQTGTQGSLTPCASVSDNYLLVSSESSNLK